jgi:Phage integrase, N-terminal SAM-like domain
MSQSDLVLRRIVDVAAADSHVSGVDRPRVHFPELSAPVHPLGSMPFPEAAKAWLQTRRDHIAPRTYLDYGRYIETLARCFRNIALGEITEDMVRDYQSSSAPNRRAEHDQQRVWHRPHDEGPDRCAADRLSTAPNAERL